MKMKIHSSRKSFKKWAMTGQRVAALQLKVKHNAPRKSIPARMKPGGLIQFGRSGSLDARRFNRPESRPDKFNKGPSVTRRGLSPKKYARTAEGPIVLARKFPNRCF